MIAPHYADDVVTLHHGDVLAVLRSDELGYDYELGYGTRRAFPDASVDAVVTDPPYGLEFMGREWDGADGFRRSLNAADAGRESVFGRTSRTSPEYRAGSAFQEWCEAWAAECLRVLKPGGHLVSFGGSRTWHRLAAGVEDAGFEIRDSIAWLYGSGFPKSLDVAKAITGSQLGHGSNSGAIRRATMGEDYTPSGVRGNRDGVTRRSDTGMADRDLTLTPDAGPWQGWGTALKPAFEPIVVGRKPLAGTVAANVLAHGTGALNIDATRVGEGGQLRWSTPRGMGSPDSFADDAWTQAQGRPPAEATASSVGRWPTNVVLDDAQAAELDRQAPDTGASGRASGPTLRGATDATVAYGARGGFDGDPAFYGDRGGASRFFPVFRYEAKAPTSERPRVDGVAHPTVKPLDLMRWLVRLVTPPGGVVLEPFAGSGTTAEACVVEGFRCIAIEREADYLPLITSRLTKPIALAFDLDVSA